MLPLLCRRVLVELELVELELVVVLGRERRRVGDELELFGRSARPALALSTAGPILREISRSAQ